MSNVPTNLIPTRITGLPEYTGTSTEGYLPYILEGRTFKVQFGQLAAVGAVPSTRVIAAGTGLAGGGDLSENRVISIAPGGVGFDQLSASGVVAGTYGSGAAVPVVTVDVKGRVTDISTTPLSITGYVPDSRLVSTGAGLLGGGSLAANRTLSVDFYASAPQALGSASPGVSNAAARGDHVHPAVNLSDTTQTQGALPLGRGGTGDALSPVAGAVVYSTGTKFALADPGDPGQVFTSNGAGEPYWRTISGTGTVTNVSVITANGFGGTVAYADTTPQITLTTTVNGMAKGDGLSLLAAIPGTDYVAPSAYISSGLTMATSRLLGRTDLGTGEAQEITIGTGLSLSSGSLVNSAPDQVVSLTGGTAISVSGTYPSFTVTNTAPDQIVSLTGAGTTIVTGTYPNFTITSNDQYAGTVTSVAASGGSTGLTFSGSPITTSGTLTLGGTLAVASGGTGATTAADARTNLGAAASGANSDITSLSGITGGIATPDYIDFDTAAAPARATGRLWWDSADGIQTLNLGMAGSNATLQIGEEMYFRIKASSAITEGQVVMFTGSVGNSGALTGAPATGLTKDTASYVMGVATESIALNGWGYVTQFGLVRNINTTGGAEAWVDGQILYYNPAVPGGLTKTVPTAPAAKVEIAAVVNAASNGSLFIRPIARFSLTQLNDVESSGAANSDLLQYNGTGGYWEHKAPSTISVGTATNLAGGAANRIAYQTGAGATGFISAPVTSNTFLEWSGSAFQWAAVPAGTVSSVAMSVPTGLTVTGSPITTSGTLAVGLQSGYSIPTTASQTNWDTAYSDRLKWDGGSSGLVAATGRTSLGLGTAAVLDAGVANGVATLDSAGTVPTSQLPAAILGALNYQGAWNASTNTPTLTSSVGTKGYFYVVDVAGSTNLNGITDWKVGDWAVYSGTVWQKIDNTDSVVSVNGYTGVVNLNYADVGAPSTSGAGATGTWGISVSGNAGTVTNGVYTTGSYTDPTWLVSLAASKLTGTVAVTNGGTGATSLSSGYLLKGNGTSAVSASVIYDNGTNVGIGTSSPATKLNVIGDIQLSRSATASDAAINFGSNANNYIYSGNSSNLMAFATNGSERMRIDSSGNVGIGTSSPSYKLQAAAASVGGASYAIVTDNPSGGAGTNLAGFGFANGGFLKSSITAAVYGNDYMAFNVGGSGTTERMRITSAGDVGVGTSSPSGSTLTLQSKSLLVRIDTDYLKFNNAADTTYWGRISQNSNDIEFSNRQAGALKLLTSDVTRMTIASGGNVGIGTSSPVDKLQVEGNLYFGTTSRTIYAGGAANLQFQVNTGAMLFSRSNGSAESMRIDSSGNVGIGTSSPAQKLHVATTAAPSGTTQSFLRLTGDATYGADFGGGLIQGTGPIATISTVNAGTATERLRIDSSGNLLNYTSVRAPIFYDYDNTAYYLDPSSISNINGVQAAGTYSRSVAGSGYLNGNYNAVETNSTTGPIYCISPSYAPTSTTLGTMYGIGYADGATAGVYSGVGWGMYVAAGGVARVFLDGQSGVGLATGSWRAPLFYDSNDTAYYLDAASTSVLNSIQLGTSPGSPQNGAIRVAPGSPYSIRQEFGSDNSGWRYGIAKNVGGTVTTLFYVQDNGAVVASGDMRAPIFYDSDNTGYYVNPASTSVLSSVQASDIKFSSGVGAITLNNGTYQILSDPGGRYAIYLGGAGDPASYYDNTTHYFRDRASAQQFIINNSYALHLASVRAPIFYDSDNTGYYADPAGTSNFAGLTVANTISGYISGAKFSNDSETKDDITTRTESGFYQSSTGTTAEGWPINDGGWQHLLACTHSNDSNYFSMQFAASFFSPSLFYRSTNGSGSTAWSRVALYGNGYAAPLYASIYYDADNTGYYCNPASTSSFVSAYTAGQWFFRSLAGSGVYSGAATSPGLQAYSDDSGAAYMSFHRSGYYATNMGLDPDNVIRIGGWSASANRFQMDMSGNLTMAGNVTAYSDARLKKDVETIDGALDLVSKMRGVRFTRIETEERGVGVIAQEMLEVVPEAVQQGIGDDDTLSVAYGNLVGVLIEAIKELEARVAELEGK